MLTDKGVRSLKPAAKPYKRADERGLFVMVRPDGGKWWRFRYVLWGKEKLLSLGTYPDIPLKLARERRDEARRKVAQGVDPSAERQEAKRERAETFEAVAAEYLKRAGRERLSASTINQLRRRLSKYALPYIGRWPVAEITAPELLKVLRRIESRGTLETAHRVRSLCSRVFRYAVATGKAERDPAADLKGALAPTKTTNFAAITEPKRIGELLRAIDDYQGQPSVMYALRLAPLVFVRPGELRGAQWCELTLDGDAPEWRLPGERTKMGDEHVVPLSRQAVALVREFEPLAGSGPYLFPSLRTRERPISDNTLNSALRRIGYAKHEMTSHGFRSLASTRLNEMGWPPDVIELQLGHVERNKVRAAYNRAQRLAERREMMQQWADYLDALRSGGSNVVALKGAAQ